jgi:hypothetical protein
MYSTIPIHWNIKSAPASPGRSRVGPTLYLKDAETSFFAIERGVIKEDLLTDAAFDPC